MGLTPKQEWSAFWKLPVTAMLGMSGSTMFAFSSGVFMGPMIAAFGWSRTQFASAFTFQMISGLILLPFLGRLVDRIGARRIALVGGLGFVAAFSLLACVNGIVMEWWVLCILLALFQACVSQSVWISPVVGHFNASRGLAMAVALAGLGLGSLIWPIISALYIQHFGWRPAFPALGLTWGVIVIPLVAMFFFDARKKPGLREVRAVVPPIRGDLLSRSFICIAAAGGLFSCAYYGLIVHFVSILRGSGLSLTKAAAITGLVGASSMAGRIATGYVLDHVAAYKVGRLVFLMPIVVVWLLWVAGGSFWLSALAAMVLGVASGAEIDIVTYIVSHRFRPEVFASVYAIAMAILSVSASIGPTLAAAFYDSSHSYTPYLLSVVPMSILGSALISCLGADRRKSGSSQPHIHA